MLKKAAIYVRVSTADQDCAMQTRECAAYCDRRGWEYEVYRDEGESGAKRSRPRLDAMLAEIRRGKFAAVVVYRYDRFARSSSHLITTLDEFRQLGVDFVSIHEAVDTSTPSGRAMFTILAAFAEMEREIIRERVASGIEQARRKGVVIGRPPRVWDRAKAREMLAQGMTKKEVADRLGVSRATFYREIPSGRSQ
jgi:DNA invertase Pin-like site-specific DNA recombinase